MENNGQKMLIRRFDPAEENELIELWRACGLTAPQNDPHKDIAAKFAVQSDMFLVGVLGGRLVATVMVGYDGHRGWINYLGVHPDYQRLGLGGLIMDYAEAMLRDKGCPKINLQVRKSNLGVVAFYQSQGFREDEVISMGKRL
jgi:ribosomal protein S18 acetylase RimI-like enzyme